MAKIIVSETFYPKTRSAWRKWLQINHAKKAEIWLMRYKKVTGKPTVSYEDSVEEALCYGWIDGMEKGIDEQRFATRFTPRRAKSSWSDLNVAKYKKLVSAGLMRAAGRKAFEEKFKVYSAKMMSGGRKWHETHKMVKGASLEERVRWHREHQKKCGCRPVPKGLRSYL